MRCVAERSGAWVMGEQALHSQAFASLCESLVSGMVFMVLEAASAAQASCIADRSGVLVMDGRAGSALSGMHALMPWRSRFMEW